MRFKPSNIKKTTVFPRLSIVSAAFLAQKALLPEFHMAHSHILSEAS